MHRRLGKFSIVIDSNEYYHGNTWVFNELTHVRSLVKYGCDYSIRGQIGIVGVERKSYPDYVACCGTRWKDFQKQLKKLQKNRMFCVIVEAHIDDPIPEQSRMVHAAVIIRTVQVTMMGIPVLFAGTRSKATRMCVEFFKEALKQIQDA